MPITREQAIVELQKRGISVAESNIPTITPEQARTELGRRGISLPEKGRTPIVDDTRGLAEQVPTPTGLIEQGNIDLDNQFVRRNEDGSISTVKSRSFNFDSQEVLLDMVDQTGKLLTDKEAKEQYRKTGKHLGKFSSVESANKYAEQLSKQQAKLYDLTEQGITPTGIRSIPVDPEEQIALERNRWLQEQIESGQIEPVDPSFWERFKEDIPQMAGGTVGGITGAKVGAMAGAKIPVGHPLLKGVAILGGAGLGAFAGGMGGKGYQQYYRQKTRPTAKPMTLGEIYNEQIIAGLEEAAAELVGRGIAKVGAKALAPLRKRLIKEMPIKQISKQLLKRGAVLTPAQATESRIIDTLEGMAEKSFLGGGELQRLKRYGQPVAFSKYIDDVVKQISKGTRTQLSPEDVGDLLFDAIEGKRTIFKATAKAAYNKVDRLAGGAKVNLRSLKEFAKRKITTAVARKGIGSTQAGDTLLKKVLQLDDIVSFRQGQALRSALIDERSAMAITKDKAIGLAKEFIRLTDSAMEQGTKELSPEALKAWRITNKFYRQGMETFNKKIIKTLTKNLVENPEVAVRKIFRPGATKQIKVVKNLVDKKTWYSLQTGYLEQLIRETSDTDGIVLGKSFLNRLNKMGQPTLKEMFNGEELAAIRMIGQIGEVIQRPTGGSGAMLIQLMQAGAVVNLGRMAVGGTPALVGESATIVIGPPILSRLLVMPKFARWLSYGYKLPRGTPAATALGTRIIKEVFKIQNQINEEKREKVSETQLPPLRERLSPAKTGEAFMEVFK